MFLSGTGTVFGFALQTVFSRIKHPLALALAQVQFACGYMVNHLQQTLAVHMQNHNRTPLFLVFCRILFNI